MVLIIHSALRFIYYVIVQQVENWTQLLLSVSLEYTVLQKKKNGFNICVQCQHTWHLVCTDETDDPFHCLNCRGLGKHE